MSRLTEEARNTRKTEEKFHAELSAQTTLANLYKSQFDEQTSKVGNLNKVIKELQSMLKSSARKQEDLIRDQNRNMIDQLYNMGKRVSEVTNNILNVTVNDDSSSKSRQTLTSNIKYLKGEKDVLSGKLKLSQAETARLKSQLDNFRHENIGIKKILHEKTKAATDSQEKLKKLKKELDSSKVEQKALEQSLVAKNAEIKRIREDTAKLKKIGTSYRSKFQEEETKTKELTAEKEKLDKDSSIRIADLEVETKELKNAKEKLVKKEARSKVALSNAKDMITRVENEKNKLRVKMETFSPIISDSCAGDETPRPSRPTSQTTLKRARDSSPAETEMVSGSTGGEAADRARGEQKKQKSEGQ